MGREPGASAVKLYYRIGEVAGIVGVEPHVLRYWETEFPSIRPQKSRSGQRVYSRRDVDKLLRVKELLYAQRFTIAGARQRLKDLGSAPAPAGLTSELPNRPPTAELEDGGAQLGPPTSEQAGGVEGALAAPGSPRPDVAQVGTLRADSADSVNPAHQAASHQAAICLRAALLGIRAEVCQLLDGVGTDSLIGFDGALPHGGDRYQTNSPDTTSFPGAVDTGCDAVPPFENGAAEDVQPEGRCRGDVALAVEPTELRFGTRRELGLVKFDR